MPKVGQARVSHGDAHFETLFRTKHRSKCTHTFEWHNLVFRRIMHHLSRYRLALLVFVHIDDAHGLNANAYREDLHARTRTRMQHVSLRDEDGHLEER